MSYIEEMLEEILKLVYREYREIVEIERLTCELEETLNHSDRKSANLILEMRQSEMERVSQAKRAISELLESMDDDLKNDIKRLLEGEQLSERKESEAERISMISRQRNHTMENTRGRRAPPGRGYIWTDGRAGLQAKRRSAWNCCVYDNT